MPVISDGNNVLGDASTDLQSVSGSIQISGSLALVPPSGSNDHRIGVGTLTPKTALSVVNDYTTDFEDQIADGEGGGEILRYNPGTDPSTTVGQLYYLHTNGIWANTDADAVATGGSQLLGIAMGTSPRNDGMLLRGFVRIPATEVKNIPGSGAVDGLPLYVSIVAGHVDFSAPSGSSDFVRVVGYAIDDDNGDVLAYFNPDGTWVVVS
jgi:hypothetical protein